MGQRLGLRQWRKEILSGLSVERQEDFPGLCLLRSPLQEDSRLSYGGGEGERKEKKKTSFGRADSQT